MKLKSEYILILILIFILFSITAVSASENQTVTVDTDENYMSADTKLMEENPIEDSYETPLLNNDSNQILCTDNNNDENQIQDNIENSDNTILQADNTDDGEISENNYSFSTLYELITQQGEELDIEHDYRFNESYDHDLLNIIDYYEMEIDKNKLVINGFNHVIDGAGKGAQFSFNNKQGEITINNLTFKNFNTTALYFRGKAILNNVNFTNCSDSVLGVISVSYANMTANNCGFYQNYGAKIISESYSTITINNSIFSGYGLAKAISGNRGNLHIFNSIFENFTSNSGSIIDFKGDCFELVNSKFANSYSDTSGGAILAKYFPINNGTRSNPSYIPSGPILIKGCIFDNLTCSNDGGAIHIDLDSGSYNVSKIINIEKSNFTDCTSRFGGAISILGGTLNINECNFMKNNAGFKGGAIYSSWSNINIAKSNFKNNTAANNGGAICFDKHKLLINESNFTGNKVLDESDVAANAIYAHDVEVSFINSTFDNGGVAVYADFASNSKIENVEKNNDIFMMDNHNYIVSVENSGIKLNFTGNEIIVDTLPFRFDAREWGWTTPEKMQGDNDDCWAFATIASIETSLGKSTGILFNLSQNYVQKLQLKYSDVGDIRNSLTGFSYSGLGYALSWYGVLPIDGPYDDRGMIADTDINIDRIHVQDAMFIYTGMKDTIDLIKRAVLKYGAVSVQSWVNKPKDEIPTNGEDIAIMDHSTHFVSIIGWDDSYVDRLTNEKGGWITKDSLNGFNTISYTNFPQVDYYAIVPQRVAIAYIFENDIDYHVNYQTDLTGLVGFDENYNYYSNKFTSKYNELIGAVGTYFNESGINYSFDIFVNGKMVHSQSGTSEFAGFRTIVLNKYIPVKTGDLFKVVFKSNSVPYQEWSRMHYMNETSFISKDMASWIDLAPLNKTVCLKVYTVADNTKLVNNKNISVDYVGGSYFSVKVVTEDGVPVGSGESVIFTINGKTIGVQTDSNGIAKILINEKPGRYTITINYKGQTYKNTVTVKHVIAANKVTVKNTYKKLVIKATLKINGKSVKGRVIKFTFKGKTYKAKTNTKGIATVIIKQTLIQKLSKKSYPVKVIYLKDTVKTTVNVKQVLKANKITVKKSVKNFKLKASLKINGKVAKKKLIKFKMLGKTYKAKTNTKGIAKVTIKKSLIKNLKKGKTYAVKVYYGKDYIKTSVKVKK